MVWGAEKVYELGCDQKVCARPRLYVLYERVYQAFHVFLAPIGLIKVHTLCLDIVLLQQSMFVLLGQFTQGGDDDNKLVNLEKSVISWYKSSICNLFSTPASKVNINFFPLFVTNVTIVSLRTAEINALS